MLYNKKIFERVFCFEGKYWYRNIFQIPCYFRCIHRLVKYGYDEMAHWDTYSWFIDNMKDILTHYRKHHIGYPLGITCEEWDSNIDKMISLLSDMEEWNPKYEDLSIEDTYRETEKAKNEFFELFSKCFYNLWD